jgi:SAM-dependent methyltransferase
LNMTESKNLSPEAAHYFSLDYDSKQRFASYWHQIDEIFGGKPEKILVVGVGNGFVARYLRSHEADVTTVDTDGSLGSDFASDVLDMPFEDETFDTVSCCQVLEHLPYQQFMPALREIGRVTKKRVVLSLPDIRPMCSLSVRVSRFGYWSKVLRLPRFINRDVVPEESHFWEIERRGYPLRQVMDDIRSSGFVIEASYNVFELHWHRFFILKKV